MDARFCHLEDWQQLCSAPTSAACAAVAFKEELQRCSWSQRSDESWEGIPGDSNSLLG